MSDMCACGDRLMSQCQGQGNCVMTNANMQGGQCANCPGNCGGVCNNGAPGQNAWGNQGGCADCVDGQCIGVGAACSGNNMQGGWQGTAGYDGY